MATTSSGLTPLWGSLAEEFLGFLSDGGHARHAADEHDLRDIVRGEAGVLEGALARADGALDEVGGELLQLGSAHRDREVLGA